MVPVFKNVGERSTAKNYRPVSLLSVVSKVFEKLVNNRIVDHLEKCGLFSDFQYGFRSSRSTADLLTVVSDELLGLLTGLGLLELWHLTYPRLLTGFGMLVFFTNLSVMVFQVRYSALFLLFSVIDDFEWFWMESLHKNIELMWEFLKAPFLVLHFSYYKLMTFLMTLSVILLSMLMIILYILGGTGRLICGNNLNWLLNLNLIYERLWTGSKKWLVDFNAGKTQLVSFDRSNSNGSIDVKMGWFILEEKSSFKMLGLAFSSKLDRGSYIISIAKTASKKIGALIRSMKLLSPEVALYLYKSTICP